LSQLSKIGRLHWSWLENSPEAELLKGVMSTAHLAHVRFYLSVDTAGRGDLIKKQYISGCEVNAGCLIYRPEKLEVYFSAPVKMKLEELRERSGVSTGNSNS